jgi:flagellar basal body-associated protein FliL
MMQFRMSSNSTTQMIDRVQRVMIFFIIAVVLVLAAVVGIALALVLGPALLLLLVFGLAMIVCVALVAGLLKLGVIATEAFLHTKMAQASHSAAQRASKGGWVDEAEPIILGAAAPQSGFSSSRRTPPVQTFGYPGAHRPRQAGQAASSVADSGLVKRLHLYVSTTAPVQNTEVLA